MLCALFQSFLAIAQVKVESDLNLKYFGEPQLEILNLRGQELPRGIAKFDFSGGKILRAYGTFPHPNVLGLFLIIGLICLIILFTYEFSFIHRLLLIFSGYIISFGIILSFSRIALLSLFIIFLYILIKNFTPKRVLLTLGTLFILTLLILFNFPNYKNSIKSHAYDFYSSPSVINRLNYNKLGLEIIYLKPFGVGIGNQVIYSVENDLYENYGFKKVWEFEPIHNLYILIASEVGILGIVFLIIYIGFIFKSIINKNGHILDDKDKRIGELKILLFSLIIFSSFFDHFLWTLESGRLIFALSIGLMLGISHKKNHNVNS